MYEKLVAGLEPATYCLPQKSSEFRGPRRRNHHSLRLIPTCFSKIKRARFVDPFYFGATGRTRTGDLLITNQLLYQLSHSSTFTILLSGSFLATNQLERLSHSSTLTISIVGLVSRNESAGATERRQRIKL